VIAENGPDRPNEPKMSTAGQMLQWIVLSLLGMAVITGYRRAAKPDKRAERFRKSAKRHHALFDDFRDFLMITLPILSSKVSSDS
jgi:hypothetical protein